MFLLFSPSHQQRAKESTQIQKKGSQNIVSFGGTWHVWMRARLLSCCSCEWVCMCVRALECEWIDGVYPKKVEFAAIYCHFWVCKNDNDWFHIILCDIFHRLPFCHCRHTKNWRNKIQIETTNKKWPNDSRKKAKKETINPRLGIYVYLCIQHKVYPVRNKWMAWIFVSVVFDEIAMVLVLVLVSVYSRMRTQSFVRRIDTAK